MLEKPDLPDQTIVACLRAAYGLNVVEVTFLPLGADVNTAVYRVLADHDTPYFLKLRRGTFDEVTVAFPKWLHDRGISQVITVIPNRSGQLSTPLDDFKAMLSPFVQGHNGFAAGLSDRHWVTLGEILKGVHTTPLPPALQSRIPRETFSAQWREIVRGFQQRVEQTTFEESIDVQLADLLKAKRAEITHLVQRAEQLAAILQTQLLEFVPCHADIHAGNVFIDACNLLYVVDWDTLILAPKERDLMFVGGGQFGTQRTAQQEEALFYQGYVQTEVNPVALAYYRYERIVQDIAAYTEQILLTGRQGEDRVDGLRRLNNQFRPNVVTEMAYRSEQRLPPELRSSGL